MGTLMTTFINWLEAMFAGLPFEFLQVWGRVGYVVGIALMVLAYGGFTFMPAGRWGLGRERQTWDGPALTAMAVTSLLIIGTGYIGSFIVLVPGAQTFESMKDCAVFVCIVLFGRPALLMTPIAYGISDLIEGVPPGYELDWALGYWINPACFWPAYQMFGRDPDFRRAKTWGKYLAFVAFFMSVEPELWGYICAGKFTPEISYHQITPALFFTTSITWIITPAVMLAALPLARKYGWFWAEIPGHVQQRLVGRKPWTWAGGEAAPVQAERHGVSLGLLLVCPFLILTLVMVISTAYVGFRSAEDTADKLVGRLHEEVSENINIQLDDYLEKAQNAHEPLCATCIDRMLAGLPIAEHGLAFAIDHAGRQVVTSIKRAPANQGEAHGADVATDDVARTAIRQLYRTLGRPDALQASRQFRFVIVTSVPLSRETWLAQATPYSDRSGRTQWVLVTAMPEAYYLAAIRAGNSQVAMLYAVTLVLSLATVIMLAAMVSNPVRRIAQASTALASGNWAQQVPDSRVQELSFLSRSFNDMTHQLREAFRKVKMGEAIVDSSEDAIIGATLAGAITRWNKGAETIFGYTAGEIVGRSVFTLAPPGRQTEEQKLLATIRDGASVQHFQTERIRKDGQRIEVSVTFSPIRDDDMRIVGASIIARDITAYKLAEAAIVQLNARLQALFDAAQEIAIIATDADGRITVFNHGAERMLGYPAGAMLTQSLLMLHRDSEIRQRAGELTHQLGRVVTGFETLVALTRSGKSEIRSWTYVRNDGAVLRVSLAVSAVCDEHGHITGFLGIARDITQQLEAEASLRILNQQLDQRVQERTRALQDSTLQLQSAVDNLRRTQTQLVQSEKLAALGSIVAAVAHELNTPIGNCVCVASTLLEMTGDFEKQMATGKLQRKHLDTYLDASRTAMNLLQRGLERAAELITNFKQVAVDQSTEQRRWFPLRGAVNGVVDLLRVTLRNTRYRIELDIADTIQMDSYPGAIEQIVSNLVNNSVLHGFAGREQGLMRLHAQADGDRVVLTYSDDGQGMAEEVLRHVFDPFFTTRLGTGGSGLGMHICYNLVANLLGGSVEASSTRGQGATFVFVLPRVAPGSGSGSPEHSRMFNPGTLSAGLPRFDQAAGAS